MSAVIDIKMQCRGRWADILVSIGLCESLFNGKHQPCPSCGGKDRFRWHPDKEFGICNQCGSQQPVDMAMKHLDLPFKAAVEKIRSVIGQGPISRSWPAEDYSKNEARLKRLHAGLKRIAPNDPVWLYLRSRGITVLPKRDVYTHPALDYWGRDDQGKPEKVGSYPAMVSMFRNPLGEVCTYHATYITSGGQKIVGHTPKKMLPKVLPLTGGAIQHGGVGETLIIAEGIETSLAAQQEFGYPAWAAANAAMMEQVEIPAYVRSVIIVSDEDASFTGQKAAYTLANRLKVRGNKDVSVVRLINKSSLHIDTGINVDFLDYYNATQD